MARHLKPAHRQPLEQRQYFKEREPKDRQQRSQHSTRTTSPRMVYC